ncbi:pantothenate kinase [Hydrogenobacter thermophilus]|uniref:pantothenate kinase n=1 Tax=Hydrogenobacter thermophilus TaxID=940 RepID=UPI0030FA71D3
MKSLYTREDLFRKNIYIHGSNDVPDSIEITDKAIIVKRGSQSIEIPLNSMRGKAILDRLSYDGELVQEIYL